jgi:putative ABC transport system ATP-binding protein
LHRGDEVAIVGRSGSGKTTLLLVLAELLTPSAGTVRRFNASTSAAVVFQSPSLLPELTAIENISLPLRLISGVGRHEATQRAREALDNVGLASPNALPGQLSGGQQQRVAIARVLATAPTIILADEPTGSLDTDTGQQMMAVLRAHRERVDGALLVATHDSAVADSIPSRYALTDGVLVGRVAA